MNKWAMLRPSNDDISTFMPPSKQGINDAVAWHDNIISALSDLILLTEGQGK